MQAQRRHGLPQVTRLMNSGGGPQNPRASPAQRWPQPHARTEARDGGPGPPEALNASGEEPPAPTLTPPVQAVQRPPPTTAVGAHRPGGGRREPRAGGKHRLQKQQVKFSVPLLCLFPEAAAARVCGCLPGAVYRFTA
ncbi:translation initiation factor IF-2-like [Lemur catta]|uniref:translation initiation factor IF-2-like n=1 Tax=Lemur catta TaxID=9447 RepID=UPI001E2681E8|nr:translation initiation factor IF-2-like [Lemur catta]